MSKKKTKHQEAPKPEAKSNADRIEALLKRFNYGLDDPRRAVDERGQHYTQKRIEEGGSGDVVTAWVNRGWNANDIEGEKNEEGYVTKEGLAGALKKEFGPTACLEWTGKNRIVDGVPQKYGKFTFSGLNGEA